jgi:hypothetical protein
MYARNFVTLPPTNQERKRKENVGRLGFTCIGFMHEFSTILFANITYTESQNNTNMAVG